jgi:hypothetical protein
MGVRRLRSGALIAVICAALAAPASGQTTRGAARADISGYWLISFGPLPPRREPTALEQSLLAELEPNTLLLADSGLVEFRPGDYGGLRVRSELAAAAAGYDPDVQRSVATTCLPPGVIYAMQGPFPIEIFQGTELLVIKMEYYDQVRIVFMNETEHPDDWPLSALGHSIGRWDGNTLVVDTRFLKSSTLFNNGLDHSDRIRLLERFRMSEDGATLAITQEFEDPQVFEGRAARIMTLARGEDHVYPYECDPSYGVAIDARERQ